MTDAREMLRYYFSSWGYNLSGTVIDVHQSNVEFVKQKLKEHGIAGYTVSAMKRFPSY